MAPKRRWGDQLGFTQAALSVCQIGAFSNAYGSNKIGQAATCRAVSIHEGATTLQSCARTMRVERNSRKRPSNKGRGRDGKRGERKLREPQRLSKVLAQMGVASRRESEKLIADGEVMVNKKKVQQQGVVVIAGKDVIHVHGKEVRAAAAVWVAVHKPRGTPSIAKGSGRSVEFMVPLEKRRGLVAVDALEEDASGVMILSNERNDVARLNSANNSFVREWMVDCYGRVRWEDVRELEIGVKLDGERELVKVKVSELSE